MRLFLIIGLLLSTLVTACTSKTKATSELAPATQQPRQALRQDGLLWLPWSNDLFTRAKQEKRLVLLDLEAVWCHWCHVMDETTYRDPRVQKILAEHFLVVKVDQDSRPDLSNRYEDYGWPATILFKPDGTELVKRSGYIPPDEMVVLLEAVVKDPTPGPSAQPASLPTTAASGSLSAELRARLVQRHLDRYDFKAGGWGFGHKLLDGESVEYAMDLSQQGDAQAAKMARQTLDQALHLMDSVWGGVYQYSTGGNWNEPHFEKIMSVQAENLRAYAEAYALWQEPRYRQAAEQIASYLNNFLTSPEGAFYTSQDADLVPGEHSADYFAKNDAERKKLGTPRVDQHCYARENGWAINALAILYGATGDKLYLDQARRAAEWVLKNRSLGDGGFRHDERDASGPYLGGSLAMGVACASLYTVTGERRWLEQAERAARFIAKTFSGTGPDHAGFVTAASSGGFQPIPQRDENTLLARFANQMFHLTGKQDYQQISERAMRFLTIPEVAENGFAAGPLLADSELTQPPLHITVVGHKDDAQAQQLFQAVLRYPVRYRRIEWLDKREGALPNKDVDYPELATAAAFLCTNKICSSPILQPEQIAERIARLKQH